MLSCLEPEDILSSSLQSLYSYTPITFVGDLFVHKASGCNFAAPDTASANWSLHASSIWIASLFLANHIHDIAYTLQSSHERCLTVLELGAGAGMPGILLAKQLQAKALVTLSDYPDAAILRVLRENVIRNHVPEERVRIVGHVWGTDTEVLGAFDIVLAADTLWNPEQHTPFCRTLSKVLRRTADSRIYLVAGLHTGRWTIESFVEKLSQYGLALDSITERQADGFFEAFNDASLDQRIWQVDREGEDESERRQWIVWIVIKWAAVSV